MVKLNKFIENINPAIKVIISIILTAVHSFANTISSRLLILCFVITLTTISKIKIEYNKMKYIIMFFLTSFVANMFHNSGSVCFSFGPIIITRGAINNSFMLLISMCTFSILAMILMKTLSPTDIAYVAEFFLKPFSKFKINVSEISIVITLIMRFMPVIINETKKIIIAQEARGAQISRGSAAKRIKSLNSIFIPVFVSCFRRAMQIALAMECKCHGAPYIKTNLKEFKIGKNDVITIMITFIFCFGVIICNSIRIF
ncbi:MAG: energy-coupling factor transporter transmembrane protein EcfT [Firmicutes bacterium]|nr:energy-coupling factor transporter transmembrane protein EcfT [Bacillota bacterium]